MDVRLVIGALVQDRADQVEARRRELNWRVPSEPAWIFVDQVRVMQVLDNLISHAIKDAVVVVDEVPYQRWLGEVDDRTRSERRCSSGR